MFSGLMTRTALWAWVVLALCFAATGAQAERMSAMKLVRLCEGTEPAAAPELGQFACAYWFNGFLAGYRAGEHEFERQGFKGQRLICLPEQNTVDQSTRVFLKYTSEHPEQLHESARIVVFVSHMLAFRCG